MNSEERLARALWDRAVVAFRRRLEFPESPQSVREYREAVMYLDPRFATPLMVAYGGSQ